MEPNMWLGHTPHGRAYTMAVRPATSDWNTVNACAGTNDEYRIPEGVTGWALDIGAHIGAWAIPFALDNPGVRVVCVEALPENVVMLEQNIEQNGLTGRVMAVHAAAGATLDDATVYYSGDAHHRYIGNADHPAGRAEGVTIHGTTLSYLMQWPGDGGYDYCKIDCEGCEYAFLESPDIARVAVIVGEVHRGWDRLVGILGPTHDVTGDGQDFGHFVAIRREAVPA